MTDALLDALLDSVKLIPYLLVTFLLIEFIEHKLSKKNKNVLTKNKKYGPLFGGLFGALPQCGFSSMAANLFSARVITMGTLIAVFLSTSDEMLPIMLSEKTNPLLLFKIVGFKVLVGILIGFIIDVIYNKNNKNEVKADDNIHELCEHDHCNCHHDGIIKSSIIHTLKITLFILIVNCLINLVIFKVGEDNLSNLLHHKNIVTYFVACLIGLIPNCAGSVIITEVYLAKFISVGTMIGGLLTGSGLGILLLFKTNKNLKENISILSIIYIIGVAVGMLVDLVL